MKKNLRKLIILITLIVIAFFVYQYIYQDHRDINTEKPEFTLSSDDLILQFSKNTSEAEAKFLNKTIEVSGLVSEVNNQNLVISNTIFCQFSNPITSPIDINTPINIKGRCIGYDDLLEEIKLDQCTITNLD